MKTRLFLLFVLTLSAGPALAQTPADIVEKPQWLAKPEGDDIVRYYPDIALDRSISGRVVLSCTISAKGRVTTCETLQETPWGLGFAEASIRVLIDKALFKPGKVNGKPVESTVRIPFSVQSPTPGARYVIYQPIYARAPTWEEVNAAWPKESDAPEATVVLRCSLRASGSLAACMSAGRAPDAFVGAAKRLTDKFEVRLSEDEAIKFANSDVLISLHFLNPASIEARTVSVKDPFWITTVKPEKVLSVFPAQAAEAGIKSGRGVADCLVAPDGKLTDCKVAREKPDGMGFGASAVAIAQLMQMNPWNTKGRPVVGARVKLPIDFNLADEAAQ
ncbi:TonB family protein [Caulobacter sp. NIBR1757]|uniref:TonB family protein n=1 Tax=Caulobacter sp. NIBR1757 TaxID=3016000 RepID=UPI0022F13EB8|nr:TonB family protein [Caulobacter sp. NIBR1757]WGM37194.1 hypothetical protein AMEJIAPC_00088 [Caulobacter sp. NIBR1757]